MTKIKLKYSTIEDLQNSIRVPSIEDPKKYIASLKKLAAEGKKKFEDKLFEDAFIYFYKYMLLFGEKKKIKNLNAQKDLIESKDVMTQLEELHKILKNEYDLQKASKSCEQNQQIQEKIKPAAEKALSNEQFSLIQQYENYYFIQVEDINHLKQNKTVIIIDTRTKELYDNAHLKDLRNINIPIETFPPGLSAQSLLGRLSGEENEIWRKRANYDYIILLGLNDNTKSVTPSVETMFEIITQWDPNTTYKSKPVIINGGYERVSFVFPAMCTAVRSAVKTWISSEKMINLDQIQYPNLDADTETVEEEEQVPVPKFDRSLKPDAKKTIMETAHEPEDFEDIEELPQPPEIKKNPIVLIEKYIPPTIPTVPKVNRDTKPRSKRLRDLKRDEEGNFTGFINIGNNCYQNAVIQILVHNSDIQEFLESVGIREFSSRNTVVGSIVELYDIVSKKNRDPVDCANLRKAMTLRNHIFDGKTQEDAHEFLIYLLNYIHEEVSVPIPLTVGRLKGADKEMSLYTRGQTSFIYQLFYGQLSTNIRCTQCRFTSESYSLLGCLSLEILSNTDTLDHSLKTHFSSEEVTDFRCSNCKCYTTIIKQSLVHRCPVHMMIHLKRFRGCGNEIWKNNKAVLFPKKLKFTHCINNDENFILTAIITHHGVLNQGHYKSYVFTGRSWTLFDDQNVYNVGELEINQQLQQDAYVLFYRKV